MLQCPKRQQPVCRAPLRLQLGRVSEQRCRHESKGERALRAAVIYRNLSLDSQSGDGERRAARLLSAHTTCRLQHRPLHAYLTNAIAAHNRGDPVPLLT